MNKHFNKNLIMSEEEHLFQQSNSCWICKKLIDNDGNDGKISDGHKSVKDYLTCEKNWDKLNMKNMGDYHNHYLKEDVLLSVDVFEKFIATCLKFYGLILAIILVVQD